MQACPPEIRSGGVGVESTGATPMSSQATVLSVDALKALRGALRALQRGHAGGSGCRRGRSPAHRALARAEPARVLARADQAASRGGLDGPGRGLPQEAPETARLHAGDERADREPPQGRGSPRGRREAADHGAQVAAEVPARASSSITRPSSGSRTSRRPTSRTPRSCSAGSSNRSRDTSRCSRRRGPAWARTRASGRASPAMEAIATSAIAEDIERIEAAAEAGVAALAETAARAEAGPVETAIDDRQHHEPEPSHPA